MSRLCQECGYLLSDTDTVCPECGSKNSTTVVNTKKNNEIASGTPINVQPPIAAPVQPKVKKKKSSFPWLILIVALILLLGAGGAIGYFKFYIPYKIDKEAPRYYTFAATNTILRSSQMANVDYNVLGKISYGSELIVYDDSSVWAKVKWNKIEGYVFSSFILPKRDFYILNGIWGDKDSQDIINTAKCRLALLNYYKTNGYYGVLDPQILQSVFNVTSFPPDKIWQVFSKTKDSKYNSTFFKRITNKDSKFTDFAVIIKNPNTQQRKCLLFSFSDDETPHLEYEENAPSTGDIASIDITLSGSLDNIQTVYRINYTQ